MVDVLMKKVGDSMEPTIELTKEEAKKSLRRGPVLIARLLLENEMLP